jgi:uncharacterized protein HemY
MKDLPNYLKKRKILYSKSSSSQIFIELGNRFFQEKQWNDAIDFYERADFKEGLEEIGELSKQEGDFFTFLRIMNALSKEASEQEWEILGDRAQERGRLQDAIKAYRAGQNELKLKRVEKTIAPQDGEESQE